MKADVIATQKAALLSAQDAAIETVLGASYDAGASDQKGADGTFTQADIDSAVSAAQAVDAKTLADAQAKAASDLAAVQSQLDTMTQKEQGEEAALSSLQSAVSTAQSSLAALAALIPAPAASASASGDASAQPAPSTGATPA